jgi:hypothetical protein
MEDISLSEKTDFFERGVEDYREASVVVGDK